MRITVAGEECDPTLEVPLGDGTDQQDRDVQAVLRHSILRAYDSDLSHSYKNNRNVVTLTVKKNARKTLWFTLAAFVLAIIVGVVLQLIGNEALITGLDANLLTPIRTMFLNALKMIMVPVVFFSLVNCISDLSNVSELGRIGGKTIAFYLFTCVCAICIGIGVFYLIHPGAPVAEMPQADAASLSQMEKVSILSIIVNIVPDNIAERRLGSRHAPDHLHCCALRHRGQRHRRARKNPQGDLRRVQRAVPAHHAHDHQRRAHRHVLCGDLSCLLRRASGCFSRLSASSGRSCLVF